MQPAVVRYSTEAEYDGRTYTVTVPELRVPRCEECGELVLDSPANRQITDALRGLLGLLRPEQIRQNRESLGLTQRELARHLGIAEATVSRWETGGQIQQRALDRLLRLYFFSASVRATLADEDRITELGTPVASQLEMESEPNYSPKSAPSEIAIQEYVEAVREHLGSMDFRDALRKYHRMFRLHPKRWNAANLSALTDLMVGFLAWTSATDPRSLHAWTNILQNRLDQSLGAPTSSWEHDRWFVAPLRTFNTEDAEQASRLSRLARALDDLPCAKRERAVQEFQHLMDLMK